MGVGQHVVMMCRPIMSCLGSGPYRFCGQLCRVCVWRLRCLACETRWGSMFTDPTNAPTVTTHTHATHHAHTSSLFTYVMSPFSCVMRHLSCADVRGVWFSYCAHLPWAGHAVALGTCAVAIDHRSSRLPATPPLVLVLFVCVSIPPRTSHFFLTTD